MSEAARTDEDLAIAARSGEHEAHRELVERHRGLLVAIVREDYRPLSPSIFESLLGAGEQAYREAVSTYTATFGVPVRHWMATRARWAIADAARAATREARRRADAAEMWPEWANDALVKSRIAAIPDPRMRLIASERFAPWVRDPPTQASLVARLDVGQQQVSRLETRTRNLLRVSNMAWRKSGDQVTAWPRTADSTENGDKFTVRLHLKAGAPAVVKCFRAPRARTWESRSGRARRFEAAETVEMTERRRCGNSTRRPHERRRDRGRDRG
jgi:hypothetical protein